MFHLTIFSATEGELSPAGTSVLTIFGSADLRRPTLAQQLLHFRARSGQQRSRWQWLLGSDEHFVITLFGATSMREPTIAEEYASLAAALRSGQVRREELPGLLDAFEVHVGSRGVLRTLTFFGACVVAPPKVSRERKALDAALENGTIDARVRRDLDRLVEAPAKVRWRALGEMVLGAST